jgi:predicted GNAT family N-acyltransferase
MTRRAPLHLLLCIQSDATREVAEKASALLSQSGASTPYGELELAPQTRTTVELISMVKRLTRRSFAVVLSDCADLDDSLVHDFKQACMANCVYGGWVSLLPGTPRRPLDVDRVVSLDDLDIHSLKQAILATLGILLLKAPPAPEQPERSLGDGQAIEVQPAASCDQLQDCFKLRYQVYGELGYLDETLLSSDLGIELDAFDATSVHLAAVNHTTGDLVGTVRLILPSLDPLMTAQIIRRYWLQHQSSWCRDILKSDYKVDQRLQDTYFATTPALQTFAELRRWNLKVQPRGRYAELSRLVVRPDHRGLGISRILMRSAMIAAIDLDRDYLILESTPHHVDMYSRMYGFSRMDAQGDRYSSRSVELNQIAVGMVLDLRRESSHYRAEVSIAHQCRDYVSSTTKSSSSSILCLCDNRPCWSRGSYDHRDKWSCPLRQRSKI